MSCVMLASNKINKISMTRSSTMSLVGIVLICKDVLTCRIQQSKIIKETIGIFFELDEDIKILKEEAI